MTPETVESARAGKRLVVAAFGLASGAFVLAGPFRAVGREPRADSLPAKASRGFDRTIDTNVRQLLDEGRRIFRYDTFGDEDFWGGQLRLHEAIAGAAQGGVGPGVSPATALAVGLKVDVEALPRGLRKRRRRGQVDGDEPATTLALLQHDAVVGVKGVFDAGGALVSVGIQCALCHSTVDDSVAPGIGRRLDGWANRDL